MCQTIINMKRRLNICPKILSYCMHNLIPRLRSLVTLDYRPSMSRILSDVGFNSTRRVLHQQIHVCEQWAVYYKKKLNQCYWSQRNTWNFNIKLKYPCLYEAFICKYYTCRSSGCLFYKEMKSYKYTYVRFLNIV